ncbi:MAG TPA: hypothetical protein VME67_19860 [Mycobacterium sp.]|nr:hypothetical protein [Mycobacterium sp.]HTX96901.1 hypothetical protein [Mycobacterium sp.]
MAQHLVACQPPPRSHQQPEPLIQTITHLARSHRCHPCGRQLDGQWDAVESAADLHDGVGLAGLGQREVRHDTSGTVDEQIHGGGFGSGVDVQRRDTP